MDRSDPHVSAPAKNPAPALAANPPADQSLLCVPEPPRRAPLAGVPQVSPDPRPRLAASSQSSPARFRFPLSQVLPSCAPLLLVSTRPPFPQPTRAPLPFSRAPPSCAPIPPLSVSPLFPPRTAPPLPPPPISAPSLPCLLTLASPAIPATAP